MPVSFHRHPKNASGETLPSRPDAAFVASPKVPVLIAFALAKSKTALARRLQ
jgi:hypothetical protein